MLEAASALRKAYIDLLTGIQINSVVIPIYDEQLPPNVTPPKVGAASCYILLTNQTESDISPKCNFNQECSITVDIVTKYPVGQGGKLLSEQISSLIQQIIMPNKSGNNIDVSPYFNCWYTSKELSRGLTEFNLDSTVYRKVIVFLNRLEELTPIT